MVVNLDDDMEKLEQKAKQKNFDQRTEEDMVRLQQRFHHSNQEEVTDIE